MNERWLAKELTRKDGSLVGFWPLTDNHIDYSGRGSHLSVYSGAGPNLAARFYDTTNLYVSRKSSFDFTDKIIWFAGWFLSLSSQGTFFSLDDYLTISTFNTGGNDYVLVNSEGTTSFIGTHQIGVWNFLYFEGRYNSSFYSSLNNSSLIPVGVVVPSYIDTLRFGLSNCIMDSWTFGVQDSVTMDARRNQIIDSLYNGAVGKIYNQITSLEAANWGMKSWWDLGESSGQRLDSKSTNHLTPMGTVTATTGIPAGASSGPIDNSVTDYFRFTQTAGRKSYLLKTPVKASSTSLYDMEYTQPFSVSMWVYFTGDTGTKPLFAKTSISSIANMETLGYYATTENSSGKAILKFTLRAGQTNYCTYSADVGTNLINGRIPDCGWKHIVFTYDGTNTTNTPKDSAVNIYVDGIRRNNTIVDNWEPATIRNSEPFYLGYADTGPSTWQNIVGTQTVNLVRFYTRFLNCSDVASIYTREKKAFSFNETYAFDPPPESILKLFVSGHISESVNTTLYLAGEPRKESTSFYLLGHEYLSLNTSLFMEAVLPYNVTSLYLYGFDIASGSIPLHTFTGPISTSIPLYLSVAEPGRENKSTTLFTMGLTASGIFKAADLYTFADRNLGVYDRYLNLSLLGSSTEFLRYYLNATIEGDAGRTNLSAPLYLLNSQSGVTKTAPLFISGLGITENSLPASSSLNLFLGRKPSEAITLHVVGPGTNTASGIPLHMISNQYAQATSTLTIAADRQKITATQKLYTHGF